MFAAATRNFVEEVEVGGSLIPVSSPNDSISVLTVVVERKRLWFWQKPKYTPTDFKLNDILSGEPPIKPGTHLWRRWTRAEKWNKRSVPVNRNSRDRLPQIHRDVWWEHTGKCGCELQPLTCADQCDRGGQRFVPAPHVLWKSEERRSGHAGAAARLQRPVSDELAQTWGGTSLHFPLFFFNFPSIHCSHWTYLNPLSQAPGYVPLSDPSDKGQAKTDLWDCEGAYSDHSALFRHRGGAAGGAVWRRPEPLWTRQTEGVLSEAVTLPHADGWWEGIFFQNPCQTAPICRFSWRTTPA